LNCPSQNFKGKSGDRYWFSLRDRMTTELSLQRSVHGLKAECLPFGEVLGQSIAVIAPITTSSANLGLIFALSGNGTCLSFLLGTVGLIFVSININQFARRSASPGSLYTYIAKGLGPTAGVICGWGLLLGYLFTGMAVLCGFAHFGQILLTELGIHTHVLTLLALGTIMAWFAAYKDVELSARMLLILEGISVAAILILGGIVWAKTGFALDLNQFQLTGSTPSGIAMGLVLVVFGFSGFESATTLGDEAQKPLSTIPKAVLGSTVLSGLFFLVMAYISVVGFSHAGGDLAGHEEPLSFLADWAGVSFLGRAIFICALASFFACVLGSLNPAARIFFTMARHGLFHTSLGESHDTNRTPYVAVSVASLLLFLVPASMTVMGLKPFESMAYLGTICTYGFLVTYILVSIAAPVYLWRLGKLRLGSLLAGLLGAGFMVLPILGMVGVPGSEWFPVPEAPYDSFPKLFVLYLALGVGWFLWQRSRSPKLMKTMRRSIEAIYVRFEEPEEL
jgi:amino acid transporter